MILVSARAEIGFSPAILKEVKDLDAIFIE